MTRVLKSTDPTSTAYRGRKSNLLKRAQIFSESDLIFGAPVEMIEDNTRHTALGNMSQIIDVNDSGRSRAGRATANNLHLWSLVWRR